MTEPVFPFSVPNPDYERFCKMSALLARLPPSNVIFHSSDLVCFTSLTYAVRMANVIFHSSDLVCFTTLWPMQQMDNLTFGPFWKSLAHKRTYTAWQDFLLVKSIENT